MPGPHGAPEDANHRTGCRCRWPWRRLTKVPRMRLHTCPFFPRKNRSTSFSSPCSGLPRSRPRGGPSAVVDTSILQKIRRLLLSASPLRTDAITHIIHNTIQELSLPDLESRRLPAAMGRVVKSLRRLAAYPDRTEEQRRPYLILLVVCSAMFLDRESGRRSVPRPANAG